MAIAIGVGLAGPPVAALNIWLSGVSERQAKDELDLTARRAMALAEARIARTIAVLDEVAARGVDSCRSNHVDILRQATFAATPVKELSVVAADGRTLCSDVGNMSEQRRVISSEPLTAGSRTLLEVVQLGERPDHWIRIRRPGGAIANGVAALIPSELFVPQVSARGGPVPFHVRMVTGRESQIAQAGVPVSTVMDEDHLVSDHVSKRYALKAVLTAPHDWAVAYQGDLRLVGTITSAMVAVAILAVCIMLLPRRERDNPIVEIERAMKSGEFIPYFQPIVDIRSGRLRGAEVLIRWRKPDGTIVPPATFIPLAESSGLIVEMTRRLMRRVCNEAGAAFSVRPHMQVGFNLTARHFADEQIVEDVRTIFGKAPVRLSQVVLEVTERQPIENLTETRRVIAALQGLGVRIAIDDVGTGHSGLSYMLKLGVDIIKIDKVFIDSIGTDLNSNTIIETLIDLAQNMRMEVVAEGVETFEQVVHLRELGIRGAQGYVFAPPLPVQAFLQLVEAIDPIKPGRAHSADTGLLAAAKVRADAA